MADTDLVTVVLDASTAEDIQSRIDRVSPPQWRLRKAIRMCRQAYEQGGLLTNQDLSEILNFADSLIAQLLANHERQTKTLIPRRGTIHDAGKSLSHKWIICYKRYVEGKSADQIARETYHCSQALSTLFPHHFLRKIWHRPMNEFVTVTGFYLFLGQKQRSRFTPVLSIVEGIHYFISSHQRRKVQVRKFTENLHCFKVVCHRRLYLIIEDRSCLSGQHIFSHACAGKLLYTLTYHPAGDADCGCSPHAYTDEDSTFYCSDRYGLGGQLKGGPGRPL